MKSKKLIILLSLIASYFLVFFAFGQTNDSSATTGHTPISEFSGVNTFLIGLHQECLANSNVSYKAQVHVFYPKDQTSECYVFNQATKRSNTTIEFILDNIKPGLIKEISFKIIATSNACPTNPTNCSERMNLCCMEEVHFDCCNCGQWEDTVLETYWYKDISIFEPNHTGVMIGYITAPPGFLSPMQINAKEHGCQCCTY